MYVPTLLTLGAHYVTLLSEMQNVVTHLAASQKHFTAQIETESQRDVRFCILPLYPRI